MENMKTWWNPFFDKYFENMRPEMIDTIKQVFKDHEISIAGRSNFHKELIEEYIGEYKIQGESEDEMNIRIQKNYL